MKLLRDRVTSHRFMDDPALTEDEVRDLIETVAATPSSFNMQHWRFIAVIDDETKIKLRAAAFDQPQTTEGAATFIILGDLKAHENAQDILNRSVQKGAMEQSVADFWATLTTRRYANPDECHDEAIRSGAMAAMALMTAAADKGWASCPMIGFDVQALRQAFAISDQYLPVMLVSVGRRPKNPTKRLARLSVDEILSFNSSKQFY